MVSLRPPPEFPSSPAGIVHHLSGPNGHAPTQTSLRNRGRSLVPMSQLLLSLRLQGSPRKLAHVDSWSVFQTGRIKLFCQLLTTNAVQLANHIRDHRSGLPSTQNVRPTCARSTLTVSKDHQAALQTPASEFPQRPA